MFSIYIYQALNFDIKTNGELNGIDQNQLLAKYTCSTVALGQL